jgi:transporter family-2 protein
MTSASWPTYAIIMAMTGVGIPVMAALNAGLGQRLGSPFAAATILFGVALAVSITIAAFTGSFQQARWTTAPVWLYAGGLFVALYVTAITAIAPRFGVGNAIFFVLLGQLISAAAIDHFGLLGVVRSPIDFPRCIGLLLMAIGVFLARKAA